jgi:hypothetical protein
MLMRQCGSLGAVVSAVGLFLQISTGQALAEDRRQECSAKYKTAKVDGTLGGLTWPQFFSRCMAELRATSEAPAETKPAAAVAEPVNPLKQAPETSPQPAETAPVPSAAEAPSHATPPSPPTATSTAPPAVAAPSQEPTETSQVTPSSPKAPPPPETPAVKPPSGAVFPTAIAPAYAKLKPAAARQKTCLDQFNANKANDANGGLKWSEKGGGYLSQCVKRLKAVP